MMKYSEIKLDDNQKTLLKMFKASGYKSIGNDDMRGLVMSDGSRAVSLYGLKDFDWIETNSYYEIDKLLNPPQEPKTVWDLKEGDTFWWISSSGFIYKNGWKITPSNIGCRDKGNVFLTEEEAKFEARRREIFAKVKKYARPFKQDKPNWCAYWHPYDDCICFDCITKYQDAQFYFESREHVKQAINEVGEDDFKKYYLGVME